MLPQDVQLLAILRCMILTPMRAWARSSRKLRAVEDVLPKDRPRIRRSPSSLQNLNLMRASIVMLRVIIAPRLISKISCQDKRIEVPSARLPAAAKSRALPNPPNFYKKDQTLNMR